MRGKLVYADNPTVKSILNEITNIDCESWEISLEELDYIDTAGIAMLMLMIEECQKAGAQVSLQTQMGFVRKVLELIGIESQLSDPT
jgi:anti-anti-sigma factor